MKKLFIQLLYSLLLLWFTMSAASAQQVFKTTSTSVIGYLEYLPQDYNSNSDKYPVVIFLHGIGERGANSIDPATIGGTIQKVAVHGPPMYVKNGTQFPFILISPQLKSNYGTWPSSYVMEVINYVKTYLRIDERRIYLTGLSLGGGGVWVAAQDYPELFAAIAPVCGGYNSPSKACKLSAENLPVWAFHGDIDSTVPLSRTVNMVNAINACLPVPNPLAKLTIYVGVKHDAWNKAYKIDNSVHNPNFYQWIQSYINISNKGNKIPIANAGADKSVSLPNSIVLTGSGTDADGTITSYSWTQLSGPSTATLTNKLTQSLTASGLVSGKYVFRLTVTDNSGNTDSDYINVTVSGTNTNVAPVANAGADKNITLPANSATITGSGTDSDGSIASYAWSKVSGGAATLSGAATATLSATAMVQGSYTFRLTVTDNDGAQKTDDMIVTVLSNTAPTANAGTDKSITLPANSVTITGSGTDSDGTIASYAWSKVSGGAATLSGAATATLSVTGMVQGSYTFRLTVTDNGGAQKSDDMIVTVLSNTAPTANAGADKSITLPANSVTITGSGTDTDGTIASYAWSKVSGGAATLSGAATTVFSVTGMVQGSYTFRLTVTDNGGAQKTDDMIVTVLSNTAPTANAGTDKSITLPANSVTISGSGTDSDGTIASYAWSKVSGGAATLSGATTATLSVTGMVQGSYTFRLTVTDNGGAQKTDDMIVTVLSNTAPTANAGADKSITLPANSVTITGSGTDSDGTIASYAWSKVSGGAATLSGATTATLSITGMVQGSYTFRLTVTDNGGAQKSDDMIVTVLSSSTNAAPVANAGADRTITLPTNAINITGSATDADGSIAFHKWWKVSGPTCYYYGVSQYTLDLADMLAGVYKFKLEVRDNSGNTTFDEVTITVNNAQTSSARTFTTATMVASNDESSGLGDMTLAELENSTVTIFNDSGRQIYAGAWTAGSYQQVMNNEGLYIYSVVKEGRKTGTGKVYIRE